jgi:erythritol transport system permease protein
VRLRIEYRRFVVGSLAAAVLGGTSMSGGRGRIFGTIMMGVSSTWQAVIKGVVIVMAVVIDQAQSRLQAQMALTQEAAASR